MILNVRIQIDGNDSRRLMADLHPIKNFWPRRKFLVLFEKLSKYFLTHKSGYLKKKKTCYLNTKTLYPHPKEMSNRHHWSKFESESSKEDTNIQKESKSVDLDKKED